GDRLVQRDLAGGAGWRIRSILSGERSVREHSVPGGGGGESAERRERGAASEGAGTGSEGAGVRHGRSAYGGAIQQQSRVDSARHAAADGLARGGGRLRELCGSGGALRSDDR